MTTLAPVSTPIVSFWVDPGVPVTGPQLVGAALLCWSWIHEHTILLRFLSIILRVLRLEASVYNVYITNQFQTTFAQAGGGGGKNRLVVVTVNSKEENS